MNYKARYNRIRDRVAAMSVTEKAELVCGIRGYSPAEGPVSFGALTEDQSCAMSDIRTREMSYPSPSMLACSFDTGAAEDTAAMLAEEFRMEGKRLMLGPSGAVMRSLTDGRNSERFSEEPYLTGEMSAAFLRGLRKRGVEGCLTELGCSHMEDGRFTKDNIVDAGTLSELYLESFRKAVEDSDVCAAVLSDGMLMGSRIWLDPALLERIRRQTGFGGVLIKPCGMPGDAVSAVAAGTDMIGGGTAEDVKAIEDAVKKDILSRDALDSAAIRVMAMNEDIDDAPVVISHDAVKAFNTARRAARDSMVLLKNEGGLLPFSQGEKIAVIGYAAEKKPEEIGRLFSHTEPSGVSLLEGLEECGAEVIYAKGYNPDGSTNPDLIREAREALAQTGKGLLAVCLPVGTESEGYDRRDMRLPDGVLRLADHLISDGHRLACAVMTASAVELPFVNGIEALLYTGNCGDVTGAAAADIMTGRVCPSGRLSFTWPDKMSMTAPEAGHVYREGFATGHRAAELGRDFSGFPFGYGLGYAGIEFLGAMIDKHVIIGERQKAEILYRIRNNGDRPSAHVLQVYLKRENSPIRKLVAFKKVHILPGQVRNERLEIEASSFKVYDPESDSRVFCAGQYTLEIAEYCGDGGVLDSFEMSVFPKEWTGVTPIEGRTGINSEEIRNAPAGAEGSDQPSAPDEVTFRTLYSSINGKAVRAELESVLDSTERENHSAWKGAVTDMPVNVFLAMRKGVINEKRAARAVRSTVRRNTGGYWFGKR